MFSALVERGGLLITGVEQDPDEPEFDRVYVGPRYHWKYVLAKHGEVHLGEGHTFTTLAPDAPIYQDVENCPPAYLALSTREAAS